MNTLLREYFTACVSPRGKKTDHSTKVSLAFSGRKVTRFFRALSTNLPVSAACVSISSELFAELAAAVLVRFLLGILTLTVKVMGNDLKIPARLCLNNSVYIIAPNRSLLIKLTGVYFLLDEVIFTIKV